MTRNCKLQTNFSPSDYAPGSFTTAHFTLGCSRAFAHAVLQRSGHIPNPKRKLLALPTKRLPPPPCWALQAPAMTYSLCQGLWWGRGVIWQAWKMPPLRIHLFCALGENSERIFAGCGCLGVSHEAL